MPRNVERDQIKEQERRSRLIKEGFKLFSKYGIDNVRLQSVADEAKVGVATLYNYYTNKINLVSAISADMWKNVWDEMKERNGIGDISEYSAYECVSLYLNIVVALYKEKPEILKFSGEFKTFISRESAADAQIQAHLDAVDPFTEMFHVIYNKAKEDHTIRTDYPEEELITMIGLTMLGTAERYASGIVWAKNSKDDYTNELIMLKEMILDWLKS